MCGVPVTYFESSFSPPRRDSHSCTCSTCVSCLDSLLPVQCQGRKKGRYQGMGMLQSETKKGEDDRSRAERGEEFDCEDNS